MAYRRCGPDIFFSSPQAALKSLRFSFCALLHAKLLNPSQVRVRAVDSPVFVFDMCSLTSAGNA